MNSHPTQTNRTGSQARKNVRLHSAKDHWAGSRTIRFVVLAMACWSVIVVPSIASACPTCKYALVGNRDVAFAISVLFMMSLPFLLLFSWGVVIWRLRGRLNAEPQR